MQKSLIENIRALKKQKQAVILCHNYQRPEIYEVADFVGDSLELCKKARTTDAKMIIFCGVYFMAESAAILNPKMKVVIPTKDAGCALSDMIDARELRAEKKKYPNAAVVCYVNSSAAVKAESDACCTSSNAADVVRALPQKQILFVPDKNLADFVARQVPDKEIIAWDGFCPIHQRLSKEHLLQAKTFHPDAKIIAHPECTEEVRSVADYVVSTSGMMKVAKESPATEFICTTECGMIQRMMKEIPGKKFHTVCSLCFNMKKNTLELIEKALVNESPEVKVPDDIKLKALLAFQKMFEITVGNPHNQADILNIKNPIYRNRVDKFTNHELKLDVGRGDITSEKLFKKGKVFQASIVAKEAGILAGRAEIEYFLSGKLDTIFFFKDGDFFPTGAKLARVKGDVKEILKVERVMLNLLGRMCGIATFTNKLVKKAQAVNPNILVSPTRKTLWGWLDKRACALGGAVTHRLSLDDAVLIKDNHLKAFGVDIKGAIGKFFPTGGEPPRFIEIEVNDMEAALVAANVLHDFKKNDISAPPCFIMLDNFSSKEAKKTVSALVDAKFKDYIGVEVSGGVNENNIVDFAKTGADIISIGALTHSAPHLDLSLDIEN